MDADTDGHCHERIMRFEMDAHDMQFVVVQDTRLLIRSDAVWLIYVESMSQFTPENEMMLDKA